MDDKQSVLCYDRGLRSRDQVGIETRYHVVQVVQVYHPNDRILCLDGAFFGLDSDCPTVFNYNLIDWGVETDLATMLLDASHHGVCEDRATAFENPKTTTTSKPQRQDTP
jgi:hypothetical protein